MLLGRWWSQTAIGLSRWSSAQMTSNDECDMSKLEDRGVVTTTAAQYYLIPLTFYGLGDPAAYWVTVFQQCFQSLLRAATCFSFYYSVLKASLCLVPGWCLCSDVFSENPGNSCGNSAIATTVIIVTPLLKSAEIYVN